MAFEFCPLADDVGNLADWFAVGVGTVAAVATTVVAWLAYRTSNRAAGIAEEAKSIAQQQHDEAVSLKLGTARILGSLLRMEIGLLPTKLAELLNKYDQSAKAFSGGGVLHTSTNFDSVLGDFQRSYLPAAEGALDKLHTLPDNLGALIADMIGMSKDIADTSQRISARVIRVPDMEGGYVIGGYRGAHAELGALRGQLVCMLRVSINLATEFNKFAGAEYTDYESERALC